MNISRISCVLLFAVLPTLVSAQDKYAKQADAFYDAHAWSEASEMYLTMLQQKYDYSVNYKLAECYRNLHQYENAVSWYSVLMNQNSSDPEMILRYAQLLKSNAKYKTAKEWFLKYAAYDDAGYYLASTCDWALSNADAEPGYMISNCSFNTNGSEMTPTTFRKGIIFAQRPVDVIDLHAEPAFYDLKYAEYKDDSSWNITAMKKAVNSSVHDASPCYDATKRILYFTRNNHSKNRTVTSKDGEVKLEIYYAPFNGTNFTSARPFDLNSKTYSIGQPAVSPDGNILIFASDRPGGYGGIDLYYSVRKGDDWSAAINMGPVINTAGDELFPFMSGTGTLFFASNWLPGFGGLDIFSSTREGGHWTVPLNLGLPVNSPADDFGITLKNGKGYFTSDRSGGAGSDDIYSITTLGNIKMLYVHDNNMKPVYKAKVTFAESPKMQIIGESDANGMVDISSLQGSNVTLRIAREGFLDNIISNLGNYRSSNGVFPVELQPLIGGQEKQPEEDHPAPDGDQ